MSHPTQRSDTATDLAADTLDWLSARQESPAAVDEVLQALGHQRRRLLYDVLRTHEQELTLPDAAEEVAQQEANRPITELSAERIADVYISLYHDHLPRLVEAGLLEYDQENDLVALATH
ncbi:DUF7344 domain-containing protein [Natronosalvus vescus]|uniref:DUF7344 domain-containing protein n=1 Tax=Natronosalvus vescus TaxID=2953881 RepID=UPI002091099D|nr:hypothetical protein [Natronosalvus vescus]